MRFNALTRVPTLPMPSAHTDLASQLAGELISSLRPPGFPQHLCTTLAALHEATSDGKHLFAKELTTLLFDKGVARVNRKTNESEVLNDSSIRGYISELREHLSALSRSPESLAPFVQITVETDSRDGFYLKYRPTPDFECKKFWRPYVERPFGTRPTPVAIVYVEPAFYRISGRIFLRHQDCNFGEKLSINDALGQVPDSPLPHGSAAWPLLSPTLEPSTNYVSSGEVGAALTLTQWFERRGVPTKHMTSHQWVSTGAPGHNVILLGCPRIFPEMKQLLEGRSFRYSVESHSITESTTAAESPNEVLDNKDFSNDARRVNGVVYRFRSDHRHSWFTLFSSNHSRFCEAAAEALTDEQAMRLFWERNGLENTALPPHRFECRGAALLSKQERIVVAHDIEWNHIPEEQRAAADLSRP